MAETESELDRALAADRKQPKPEVTESRDFSGDHAVITKETKHRITSLAELLAFCEVDASEWEVERWVCNKWEVGAKCDATVIVEPLFQIKAWLKRKPHIAAAKAEIEELRLKAESFAPDYPAIITRNLKETGNLAEYSLVDHHFGVQAWSKETRWADYDLKLAQKSYEAAIVALVGRTHHLKLDEALVVLGNDQQNADNRAGTTEHGTIQTMDSRYQKVFSVSRDCSIAAIDMLRGMAKRVTVVIVPGNHDPLTSWHLGESVALWYRRCASVTVDNSPTFRKYRQHGTCMWMWTHGNTGKLENYPALMAAEQPKMWGATQWREAHTGDKHHRRLLELKGATVRILPSLRPPDAWSSEMQFVGSIRAAESYVWNEREGLIGTAVYSILDSGRTT